MQLKHYDHDGRVRFVTFCTHKRLPLLTNSLFRRIVVESIDSARTEFHFRLLAYVIMPDHVHLVLQPQTTSKLGEIVASIKHSSALRVLSILRQQSSPLLLKLTVDRDRCPRNVLWQRRCFDYNCRNDAEVWEKVRYCHDNPVSRGYVSDSLKWIWSSQRWYAGNRDVPITIDDLSRE